MTYDKVVGHMTQLMKNKNLDDDEKAAVRHALTAVHLIYKLHPHVVKQVGVEK